MNLYLLNVQKMMYGSQKYLLQYKTYILTINLDEIIFAVIFIYKYFLFIKFKREFQINK